MSAVAYWFLALLLAGLLAAHPASAQPAAVLGPSTAVRVGDHPGFGRIVFDLPEGAAFDAVTEGERLLIVFRGAGPVDRPGSLPRNVRAIEVGPDTATVSLAPGAQARAVRLGRRLVVDVLDVREGGRASPRAAAGQALPSVGNAGTAPLPAASGRATGPAAALPAVPPAAPAAAPAAAAAAISVVPAGAPVDRAKPGAAEPLKTGMERPGPAQENARPVPVAAPPRDVARGPGRSMPDVNAAPVPGSAIAGVPAPTAAVEPVMQEPLAGPAGTAGAGGDAGVTAGAVPAPAAVPVGVGTPVPPTPAFVVRMDADVGAAAFRRGSYGVVVLDRRIAAPSLPPGVEWSAGAVSSVIRVPVTDDGALRLARVAAGWAVEVTPAGPWAGTVPVPLPDGAGLPVARPGRAVSVIDPLTGSVLLVGTSLDSAGAAGVAQGRRTPDYTLLPTWLGVAVEPASDRVDLRAGPTGFVLAGSAMAATSLAGPMTRRFDVPDQPAPALLNRLQAHLAGAASAAPRARTRDRMGAAQDMVALGMGAEAQALLQLAAADDPQAAADAELSGLSAIAAVLAGRPAEAEGLDDVRLDGTDEIGLWRGLRDRQSGRDTPAARRLGLHAPLALSYPPTLQRLVWPNVAEAAVETRVAVPLDRLPPFAVARLLERDGKVDEAIAAYTAIVAGSDRLLQVKAAVRLTELQLAAGRIAPADAAAALERQSIAWRGDGQEATTLLRAAELRGVAGEWRAALDALRTIGAQFPDRREAVQAGTAAVLQAMLAAEGKGLSAMQLVSLAAEHADAMPAGPAGAALANLLAEKLGALDLPARAIPVLQGLVRAAPAGPVRAELGGRLAQLLLESGDAAGAATTLDASAASGLSDGLRESRGLLQARVRAARGDVAGAKADLFELGTLAADDLRATLLADAGDWRGSLAALGDLATKLVPADGPLPEAAQAVLLRQAGAAAQVPDQAMLRVLERSAGRMTGARSDLFRVLTAAPLGSAADLPRAARELSLARAVPAQLDALRAR